MAKVEVDGQAVIKYLALGAGAVAVPALIGNVGGISDALAKLPLWGTAIFDTITVGGTLLAGLGVGLVDQLFFGK